MNRFEAFTEDIHTYKSYYFSLTDDFFSSLPNFVVDLFYLLSKKLYLSKRIGGCRKNDVSPSYFSNNLFLARNLALKSYDYDESAEVQTVTSKTLHLAYTTV